MLSELLKKKEVVAAAIVLGLMLIFSIVYFTSLHTHIWKALLHYTYALPVFGMLGFLLFILFFNMDIKESKYVKYIALAIFMPLALISLLRCYFKLPYVFCRVCPKKCVWGTFRPDFVTGVLLVNVMDKQWCNRYCPFFTLQTMTFSTNDISLRTPRILRAIKYLLLVVVIALYFAIIYAYNYPVGPWDLYRLFSSYAYSVHIAVAITVVVLIFASFFIFRPFCNWFCPIGAISEIILKIKNFLTQGKHENQ